MSNDNAGWSSFDFTLTPEAKDAFETAMQPMYEAKYTALAFANRREGGIDYCFLCDVQYVAPYPAPNALKVYVYSPIGARPYLYWIVPIRP